MIRPPTEDSSTIKTRLTSTTPKAIKMPLILLVATAIILITIPFTKGQNVGTSLANGFLITRSPITDQADLALDIRDMQAALRNNEVDIAKNIYFNGKNSKKYTSEGTFKRLRSLRSLALDTFMDFSTNMNFIFHVYGIYGTKSYSDLFYGDEYIINLLNNTSTAYLASEAAVVLNVWMYTAFKLWKGVKDCQMEEEQNSKGLVNDVPPLLDNDGVGVYAIDEAMAYWIGAEQPYDQGGYSLYNLAQETHKIFTMYKDPSAEMTPPNILSPVNAQLKSLYEQSRAALSDERRCHPGSGTSETLYHLTHRMISVMTIPLIQTLIMSIRQKDIDRIRLYALAVIPQTSACRPSTHRFLFDKLYNNLTKDDEARHWDDVQYDKQDWDDVRTALQSVYDCLGFSCADVGSDGVGAVECPHGGLTTSLGGYTPMVPHYQHARLDLDVLQIKILANMNAWELAKGLYVNGKNSMVSLNTANGAATFRSLQSLAVSTERDVVEPFYEYYAGYHVDEDYADTTILNALGALDRYEYMSDQQQTEIVIKTLSYQVLYMSALQKFYSSLKICRDFREDETNKGGILTMDSQMMLMSLWDEGVAMLIGSIEGHEYGGAETGDGLLLFNLANERCAQFDTCRTYPNGRQKARLIDTYLDLFRQGILFLQTGDCTGVETTIVHLSHTLLVPVLQSVARYAVLNDGSKEGSTGRKIAEGEVYAMSVLPVLGAYDADAGDIIETNMWMQPGVAPVQDGAGVVVEAVNRVMPHFVDAGKCEEQYVGRNVVREGNFTVSCEFVGSGAGGRGVGVGVWIGSFVMVAVFIIDLVTV